MKITMDQVRELAECYNECGLGETSSGRFLRSIVTDGRMPRGRGIGWLEELTSKGSPQSVAPLLAEIDDLTLRTVRQDTKDELADLQRRVKAGWQLSEFQQKTLARLRQQVNDAKADMDLDARGVKLVHGLRDRLRCSSQTYWAARPAITRRLNTIFGRWGRETRICPDDWRFLRENFKSVVESYENTKHPIGALRWERVSKHPVTVMSETLITDAGNVVVMVHYVLKGAVPMPIERLLIRPPK
jgi:hypothetical protein